MNNEGLNKLGEARDERGEVVMEAFGPPNALCKDADVMTQSLYLLSETIIRGILPEKRGGFLGGEFGYACEYENDIFRLYPDYQDCPESSPEFNFLHKTSGLGVNWYKWIGRDMKMNRGSISGREWSDIFSQCWESIPETARDKAKTEHDFENTPEYKQAQKEGMSRMMEVMMNPKKHGCKSRTRKCDSCGKKYSYTDWCTIIAGSCDKCMKKHFSKMTAE